MTKFRPEIKPISADLMEFYIMTSAKMHEISDESGYPRLSDRLLGKMAEVLGGTDAAEVVHAAVRFGDYAGIGHRNFFRKFRSVLGWQEALKLVPKYYFSENIHVSERKYLFKKIREEGKKIPVGKRTGPGMQEFVREIPRMFLFYGVPFASGENSTLIAILREISTEIGLKGDPRNEIRRQLDLSKKSMAELYKIFSDAINPKKPAKKP